MGCFICNEELFYHKKSKVMECSICHKKKETHQWCKNEHFIWEYHGKKKRNDRCSKHTHFCRQYLQN